MRQTGEDPDRPEYQGEVSAFRNRQLDCRITSASRLPAIRIPTTVHARDDDYYLGKLFVKDAIGKSF